jgi:hypothetical protein
MELIVLDKSKKTKQGTCKQALDIKALKILQAHFCVKQLNTVKLTKGSFLVMIYRLGWMLSPSNRCTFNIHTKTHGILREGIPNTAKWNTLTRFGSALLRGINNSNL